MILFKRKILCIGTAAVLALPSAGQGAKLLDGSFEAWPRFHTSYATLATEGTVVAGSTVLSGSIAQKGSYWQAGLGAPGMDRSRLATGNLADSQRFSIENQSLSIEGASRQTMGWENRSYAFTAPDNRGAATFTSTTGDELNEPAAEDAAFRALAFVPEPGIWAMMLVGVAAVGITLRRSRGIVSFA